MKTINLVQGSPEWHTHRANHFNASDAPAMMGVSRYKTREQFIKELATGITPEVTPHLQRLFDRGHAAEAAVRQKIEAIIGEDLYPVTGVSDEHPKLSASFDGIDMAGDIGLEVKLLNADLIAQVQAGELTDPHYWVQVEQQILVGGLKKVIFVTSNEDASEFYQMDYHPVAGRAESIVSGWAQLEKDVAAYVHEAPAAPIVAAPVIELPAVSVQIAGTLNVLSNLPDFEERARAFIAKMNPAPETDQDFADAEVEVKALKNAEAQLDAAEDSALAQIAVVDQMRKHKAMLSELIRSTRLARERLVKDRKDFVRAQIQQTAQKAFTDHVAAINSRFGRPYMPVIAIDVAGAMKGKKTMESLKNAASTEVARAKIEADRVAGIIDANLATLREKAGEHKFLFNDTGSLVLKDPEAVAAIVSQRIAEHENEQRAKAEAAAEAEREKIRREEQAKAEREAREKLAAEQAERDRQAREAQAAEAEKQKELNDRVTAAAQEFGGTEKAVVTESAPAPAAVSPIPAPAIKPRVKLDPARPSDADIVAAVMEKFSVDRRVAAGWLLTMNAAELAKVAA